MSSSFLTGTLTLGQYKRMSLVRNRRGLDVIIVVTVIDRNEPVNDKRPVVRNQNQEVLRLWFYSTLHVP